MSNPVDNVSSNKPVNITEQTGRVKETAGKQDKDVGQTNARSADPKSSTDEVLLTESAKRLQAIEQELQQVPVVDQKKVNAVKQQLADNNFQINADNVAEKLLAADKLLE